VGVQKVKRSLERFNLCKYFLQVPFLKINHSLGSFLVCLFCLFGRKKKKEGEEEKKVSPRQIPHLQQMNFWTKEFNLLKVASIGWKA